MNLSQRITSQLWTCLSNPNDRTFAAIIFTSFRIPPLITKIPKSMLHNCRSISIFSLKLSENVDNVVEVKNHAFKFRYCLQNLAFPQDTVFGDTSHQAGAHSIDV
jgi:hypothetical protein